jgi:secondary thiamine-phosphate synthase enzyme
MNKTLEFSTSKQRQLLNITSDVESVVADADVKDGTCLVFAPHATAAVLLNEDESGFKADVEKLLERWIPKGDWEHDKIDSNATSHLASALIGQSKVIPIIDSRLNLGSWQEIFFVELDGPRRNRKVTVQVS